MLGCPLSSQFIKKRSHCTIASGRIVLELLWKKIGDKAAAVSKGCSLVYSWQVKQLAVASCFMKFYKILSNFRFSKTEVIYNHTFWLSGKIGYPFPWLSVAISFRCRFLEIFFSSLIMPPSQAPFGTVRIRLFLSVAFIAPSFF